MPTQAVTVIVTAGAANDTTPDNNTAPATTNLTATATPTFSPAPGTYPLPQNVTITDATPGAAIHYTIDGTDPSASSTPYTAAIPVSTGTTIIRAIAVAPNYAPSAVAAASYTVP